MQLIALVDSVDHVCCRYRLLPFQPHLEQAGYTLLLRELPARWWGRLKLWSSLRGANVLVQRRLLASWEVAWLRRAARLLMYDFDDAVFLRDSYSPRGLHDTRRLRRFATLVRACDIVIAGNSFLGEQVRHWNPSARVEIIPTCVEPGQYKTRGPWTVDLSCVDRGPWTVDREEEPTACSSRTTDYGPRSTMLKMVWVGSASTLQGLKRCRHLLELIGASIPGIELKLICDRFLTFDHLAVDRCPWKEDTEKEEIAAADVGISWIPDDDWSRGKCGLKVLQYMAAGLPVVANPVGVHGEMIQHGQTGFLAKTPAEWIDALKRLAGDPELRGRMGQAGRRRVEQHYSVAEGAARWLGLLAGALSRYAG